MAARVTRRAKRVKLKRLRDRRAIALASLGSVSTSRSGEITLATCQLSSGGGTVEVDRQAGVIKNVSIMSVGKATGHPFELDHQSLATLVDAFNKAPNVKSRLSHPERLFSPVDGALVTVGRPKNLRVEGDQVRGDIHLGKYAARSPVGNLRDYLLDIAEEDPSVIGLSIVGMMEFEPEVNEQTGEVKRQLGRVTFLRAIDFVGDPAANPMGMLQTPQLHHATEGETMKLTKKQRAYLASLGMAVNLSDEQALAFLSDCDDAQQAYCKMLSEPGAGPEAGSNELVGAGAGSEASLSAGDAGTSQQVGTLNGGTGGAGGSGEQAFDSADFQTLLNRAVSNALTGQASDEDKRIAALSSLADQSGLDEVWLNKQIIQRTTVADAQMDVITQLAKRHAPIAGLGGVVTGGDDGRISMCAGIEDTITLRAGVGLYETNEQGRPVLDALGQRKPRVAHGRAQQFEHLSMVEMGRMYLGQLAVAGAGTLEPREIARLCLDRMQLAGHIGNVALAHSSSDFAGIFGNVMNKTLLPAYDEEDSTWEAWAQPRVVKDFRKSEILQLGQIPVPSRVPEGHEYEYVTMGEQGEEFQAFKYGCLLFFTWEMFVNDDLNAFNDQVFGFGQSAKALENDLIYAQVTSNPTMKTDGKPVFHADHNNLSVGGAASLGTAPLKQMRTAMRLQRGIAPKTGQLARHLNLRANTLLIPVEQEVTAQQMVASLVEIGASNNTPNFEFIKALKVVSESRLSDDSTTAYYNIAAGRRNAPAGFVAKLRGHETPTVERLNTGSSVDGVTWKGRHVSGAVIPDYRAWQKNVGV